MKTHLTVNRAVKGKIVPYTACVNNLWRASGWTSTLNPKEVTCKHCLRRVRRGIQLKLDLD